ncbi:unnamed protein product [Sympodiomycopsis kandeliae]
MATTTFPKGFEDALLTLGLALAGNNQPTNVDGQATYRFYCPTPETHAKFLHRLVKEKGVTITRSDRFEDDILDKKLSLRAQNLVDVFGWSLPFDTQEEGDSGVGHLTSDSHIQSLIAPDSESPLFEKIQGDPGVAHGSKGSGIFAPRVRFSNLYLPQMVPDESEAQEQRRQHRQRILYAHSGFPTTSADSVFFGPDTYRFISFLHSALKVIKPARGQGYSLALDVGTGAGAGALALAGMNPAEGPAVSTTTSNETLVDKVIGSDINAPSLRFAQVNSQLYHRSISPSDQQQTANVAWRQGSLFDSLNPQERSILDLIISNPPYIALDQASSTKYADGGQENGLALPLLILKQGVEHLVKDGVMLLYTGVPISANGHNPLWEASQQLCKDHKTKLEYWQVMDVDVFGDEMKDHEGPYGGSDVARIEVVGVGLRKL